MIHSKSLDILKTFTKEELKHFSDFVRSPFFNKNKNLIKLFDELEKSHPEFDAENEKLHSEIYPGKPYSHNNLKKLLSEMLKLTENFLSVTSLQDEVFVHRRSLLKELYKRKLDDHYSLLTSNYENDFPEEYPEHYNNRSLFEGYKLEYSLTRNTSENQNEIHKRKFTYDTCYYYFQVLIYLHCTVALKNTYSKTELNSEIDKIIKSLNLDSFINKPDLKSPEDKLLFMLSNMIMMILNSQNTGFYYNGKKMFTELFDENSQKLRDDYSLYISVLTSYCTRKMRERDLLFCREQFELFKHRLKVLENSNRVQIAISWMEISNAVVSALNFGEIDWAEEFIVKVENYTYKKDFEHILFYSKALIEFEKGNFEKSLEHTSRINIKDLNFKIALTKLKMMCYYELNLIETAYSAIDSFNHQILNSDKYNERYKSLSK